MHDLSENFNTQARPLGRNAFGNMHFTHWRRLCQAQSTSPMHDTVKVQKDTMCWYLYRQTKESISIAIKGLRDTGRVLLAVLDNGHAAAPHF